jgi:hypothetical protein
MIGVLRVQHALDGADACDLWAGVVVNAHFREHAEARDCRPDEELLVKSCRWSGIGDAVVERSTTGRGASASRNEGTPKRRKWNLNWPPND